jgi:leucyl aminopeptidase
MNLATVNCVSSPSSSTHTLVLLPKNKLLTEDVYNRSLLSAILKRRHLKVEDLAKSAVSASSDNGSLIVWAMIDFEASPFSQHELVRKSLQLLLEEQPKQLLICVYGESKQRQQAAEMAVYSTWVNSSFLPVFKKKDTRKILKKIDLSGFNGSFEILKAQAVGNLLCRELTILPPNTLTPTAYRSRIEQLAHENKWAYEAFDLKKLRKMGAGAFVAVAQGSADEDACIVHLSYHPAKAKKTIALVGKGICFDTGGHNLKPARYMNNMHEDMNGSAVALGILLAASQSQLAVNVECWLAIAQNHIGPQAYKQNDIVTALNGTSIEIVHTDAEGRMVLADTLTLASRNKPNLIIDFATLTGSMAVALGSRYSGIFATSDELAHQAVQLGKVSGERLCAFPQDEDYETALDSKIADIKQCTLDGEADHILATRFLKRFVEHKTPWLHVDLSASRCEGGLGAVHHEVTGFGVRWGFRMLQESA